MGALLALSLLVHCTRVLPQHATCLGSVAAPLHCADIVPLITVRAQVGAQVGPLPRLEGTPVVIAAEGRLFAVDELM